jgi:hypothetical protein
MCIDMCMSVGCVCVCCLYVLGWFILDIVHLGFILMLQYLKNRNECFMTSACFLKVQPLL